MNRGRDGGKCGGRVAQGGQRPGEGGGTARGLEGWAVKLKGNMLGVKGTKV